MSLVNFLRFSSTEGAMIGDQEYWNIFFRKRMHEDTLHALLDDETSTEWGIQVVYGGVGYPAVHHEAVQATRRQLAAARVSGSMDVSKGFGIREIARIAFENMQSAVRRRVDLKLRFFYGFSTDDLNRGWFEKEGERIEISNDKILEKARALAAGGNQDRLLKEAFACKAAVFGYDPVDGMNGYYLSVDKAICGFNHEGFECVGTGKYASGLSLGQDFNAKTLNMRQAGYAPAEGVLELIASATLAMGHFQAIGGRLNLVLIDGVAKGAGAYREIFDDRAVLSAEIVRAFQADLLTRNQAVDLLDLLLYQEKPLPEIEKKFFRAASDKQKLHFLLRGYKKKELPEIVAEGGPQK